MKSGFLQKWKYARIDLAGVAVVLTMGAAFYWFAVEPVLNLRQRYEAQQAQVAQQRKDLSALSRRVDAMKKGLANTRAALSASRRRARSTPRPGCAAT